MSGFKKFTKGMVLINLSQETDNRILSHVIIGEHD